MTEPLYRLGRACARHHRIAIAIWLVVVIGVTALATAIGKPTTDDLSLPGTGSDRATNLLQDELPQRANGTNPITLQPPGGGKLTSSKNAKVVKETTQSLAKADHVISAVSPLSQEGASQLTKNGEIGYIALTLSLSRSELDVDEANKIIDAAEPARKAGFEVAAGGYLGKEVSKPSTEDSEAIGLVAAVIILLFTFGTAVAMGVPILMALAGVLTGLGLIGVLGHVVEVPTVAPTLGTMIGLGVGIDYSLFLVTRHRAQLSENMEMTESIARSVATSGGAVVFAGSTVVVALLSLALAGIPLVSALGYSAALVVLVAVLTATTLLPAVLAALGERINSVRVPFGRQEYHDDKPHGWRRWAVGVSKRPLTAIAVAVVLLVVLALPVLDLELGQPDDGQLPTDTETRQAYDLLDKGFGAGTNGPFLIAVKLDPPAKPDQQKVAQLQAQEAQLEPEAAESPQAAQQLAQVEAEEKQAATPASDPRLSKLTQAVQKDPGIASVSPPTTDKQGDAAVFTAIPKTAPSDEATEDLVRHLRSDVIPPAEGNGVKAFIGGQTPAYIDLADKISDKLVSVIAIVVGLSFILLLLAFRSIVVPITAALMNLLSVGAAYGVVTAVFQKGWGESLIGLEGTTPIVSFVPLLMFAILFGLSMDYQVFLLSRVQEHFADTGDNTESVVDGLASSARVITSAALIMVAVFTSFILNGDPVVKQFGVGLAVAIAVDATIVRCLLVPAVMIVTGRANWWLPSWAERFVPKLGIEGTEYFKNR